MKNIARFSAWPTLQQLGFTKIEYRFHGAKTYGAILRIDGVEVLEIEPCLIGEDWKVTVHTTRGIEVNWVKTQELLEYVRKAVSSNTQTFAILFFCDALMFKSPLIRRVFDHPHLNNRFFASMGVELEREVNLYYANGDKREGAWSCQFYLETENGQLFEFPFLYNLRHVIDYRKAEKEEILSELAAYGITGLEAYDLNYLRQHRYIFQPFSRKQQ